MKKYLLGLMVCAAPFLLAGCGNKKTVTCVTEDDGIKMTIEMQYDKKKGEFTSAKMAEEFVYDDMDEDMADYIKENIEDACDDLDEDAGYKNCKVKTDKKGGKLTVEMDVEDLNEKYEDKDLEDIVEDFEKDDDMNCKIK